MVKDFFNKVVVFFFLFSVTAFSDEASKFKVDSEFPSNLQVLYTENLVHISWVVQLHGDRKINIVANRILKNGEVTEFRGGELQKITQIPEKAMTVLQARIDQLNEDKLRQEGSIEGPLFFKILVLKMQVFKTSGKAMNLLEQRPLENTDYSSMYYSRLNEKDFLEIDEIRGASLRAGYIVHELKYLNRENPENERKIKELKEDLKKVAEILSKYSPISIDPNDLK